MKKESRFLLDSDSEDEVVFAVVRPDGFVESFYYNIQDARHEMDFLCKTHPEHKYEINLVKKTTLTSYYLIDDLSDFVFTVKSDS